MTRARPESRKSLLAKIHMAAKDLGLDDDTYRGLLEQVTGHRSCRDCSYRELVAVVATLRKKGWDDGYGQKPRVAPEKQRLVDKIGALLAEAKRPWSYAQGIAQRMWKREKLEWCTAEELRGIVAALIQDAKRHGRQTA